jgi:hypothetical protein
MFMAAMAIAKAKMLSPKDMITFKPTIQSASENSTLTPEWIEAPPVLRDPAIMQRVRISCDLFNMAYEIKYLELQRKNPDARPDWIKQETLRLIALGTR